MRGAGALKKTAVGIGVGALLASCGAVSAQAPRGDAAGPRGWLTPGDLAVLDAQVPRRDLPCSVESFKPIFYWDLRLHAGYSARIRLKDLSGTETRLNIVFRVLSAAPGAAPVYFRDFARIPTREDSRKGKIELGGAFGLGEGEYRVDWLMRDQTGRICSAHWKVTAALPKRAGGGSLIAPGRVEASTLNSFRRQLLPPASGGTTRLNIKVLVNFASRRPSPALLEPQNLEPILSVLRGLAHEPRAARFSVIAFMLTDQRVFFRQEESPGIDFPAVGRALNSLDLGTVNLDRYRRERGQKWFLADLIKEGASGGSRPDALVVVSPMVGLEEDIPSKQLKHLGPLAFPVFYLECGRPRLFAPVDAIGRALGRLHGREYRILRPEDVVRAVDDVLTRAARSKGGRNAEESRSASSGASVAHIEADGVGVE